MHFVSFNMIFDIGAVLLLMEIMRDFVKNEEQNCSYKK
jgi:hypothetical protein